MLANEDEKANEQKEKDIFLESLKKRIAVNIFKPRETICEKISEVSDILADLDTLADWKI